MKIPSPDELKQILLNPSLFVGDVTRPAVENTAGTVRHPFKGNVRAIAIGGDLQSGKVPVYEYNGQFLALGTATTQIGETRYGEGFFAASSLDKSQPLSPPYWVVFLCIHHFRPLSNGGIKIANNYYAWDGNRLTKLAEVGAQNYRDRIELSPYLDNPNGFTHITRGLVPQDDRVIELHHAVIVSRGQYIFQYPTYDSKILTVPAPATPLRLETRFFDNRNSAENIHSVMLSNETIVPYTLYAHGIGDPPVGTPLPDRAIYPSNYDSSIAQYQHLLAFHWSDVTGPTVWGLNSEWKYRGDRTILGAPFEGPYEQDALIASSYALIPSRYRHINISGDGIYSWPKEVSFGDHIDVILRGGNAIFNRLNPVNGAVSEQQIITNRVPVEKLEIPLTDGETVVSRAPSIVDIADGTLENDSDHFSDFVVDGGSVEFVNVYHLATKVLL